MISIPDDGLTAIFDRCDFPTAIMLSMVSLQTNKVFKAIIVDKNKNYIHSRAILHDVLVYSARYGYGQLIAKTSIYNLDKTKRISYGRQYRYSHGTVVMWMCYEAYIGQNPIIVHDILDRCVNTNAMHAHISLEVIPEIKKRYLRIIIRNLLAVVSCKTTLPESELEYLLTKLDPNNFKDHCRYVMYGNLEIFKKLGYTSYSWQELDQLCNCYFKSKNNDPELISYLQNMLCKT